MLQKIDLILIPSAIFCFICAYLVLPITEQYECATGYIYEYGLYFHILHYALIIIALLLLIIVIVHRDYEVPT